MNENSKKKLESLLAYYRDKKLKDNETEILSMLGRHKEAARSYEEAGNSKFNNKKFDEAFKYFSKASDSYFKAGDKANRKDCFELAVKCESFLINKESNISRTQIADSVIKLKDGLSEAIVENARIRSGQDKMNYELLSSSIRESAFNFAKELKEAIIVKAKALTEGFKYLADSQKLDFERLGESIVDGFTKLSLAEKESALIKAEALLRGFNSLSEAQKQNAVFNALSTLSGFNQLSQAQNEFSSVFSKGMTNLSEATLQNGLEVFGGLKHLAETEKLNSYLHDKTLKDISSKESQDKLEQSLILQRTLFETAKLVGTGMTKPAMRIARSVRGGIFSEGFSRGLKDLLSAGLFRKGLKQSVDNVASSIFLGSGPNLSNLLPPKSEESIQKKINALLK